MSASSRAASVSDRDERKVGAEPSGRLDVVVVTSGFPLRSETFTSARVQGLLERGHRVRVMSYKAPDDGWRELVVERGLQAAELRHNDAGNTVTGVGAALARPATLARAAGWLLRTCLTKPGHLARALAALPFAFRALAWLEEDVPDVVHLEWGHYPAVIVPLLRWREVPCVVSTSLIAYDIYKGFPGTRLAAQLSDVVRTQARGNVPEIVAVTGLDPGQVELVPDGVDVAKVDEVVAGVSKVPGRVAVVSRLVPEKGVDDALRAFAAARSKDATLHVMGTGPSESELRRLAAGLGVEDRVSFLGHVDHDQVLRELAASEFLLHLSHMERLPNAVKEGMACGCVVVTTRTIGIEELIQDGETGYLVDVRDHAAAGAALAEALADPAATDAMRRRARRLIETTMDHAASVDKLVRLWREAAERRRASTGDLTGSRGARNGQPSVG